MNTLQQARHAARTKYAWPGGYPLFLLCADGGVICPDCAKKEWKNVARATRRPGTDKSWEVVAVDANWEDPDMYCDHCNKKIESAYGDEE